MVDELSAALTPHGWTVVAHHGLSPLPPEVGVDPAHVLWAPGAFAAKMLAEGVPLRLAAPGPHWLPSIGHQFTGRSILTTTAAEAKTRPRTGFWKLAETKADPFPAAWRNAADLPTDIERARLPQASLLQFCPVRLPVMREYRAIVHDDRVTTFSSYLDEESRGRDDEHFVDATPGEMELARRAADSAAAWIGRRRPAGPAFSLDIGRYPDSSDRFVLIEANPIWSSSWYGCDLPAFAEAVAASQGSHIDDSEIWRPDQLLIDRARRSLTAHPAPRRSSLP